MALSTLMSSSRLLTVLGHEATVEGRLDQARKDHDSASAVDENVHLGSAAAAAETREGGCTPLYDRLLSSSGLRRWRMGLLLTRARRARAER
jgi:hypothetical protein